MLKVRSLKAALAAAVFAAGAVAGTPAWADRGHDHRGHHHQRHGGNGWALGVGVLAAGTALAIAMSEPRPAARPPVVYAPPVVYTPPPVVYAPSRVVVRAPAVVASPPPVYVEQSWWYYCAAPAGYYPHVGNCPGGWTRVAPTPG